MFVLLKFGHALFWFFFAIFLFLSFRMGIFPLCTDFGSVSLGFLMFMGLKEFALSLRETLDVGFSAMLKQLRFWGFLEMDWMHFSRWDGHCLLGPGAECHGLDLKCSPKATEVMKVWLPTRGAIGRWFNLKEVGPRSLATEGVHLKSHWDPSLTTPLCFWASLSVPLCHLLLTWGTTVPPQAQSNVAK